jgi:hypothetical protein
MHADSNNGAAATQSARKTDRARVFDCAEAFEWPVLWKNMIRFCPFGAISLVGTQP